jgi:hypothetical protein
MIRGMRQSVITGERMVFGPFGNTLIGFPISLYDDAKPVKVRSKDDVASIATIVAWFPEMGEYRCWSVFVCCGPHAPFPMPPDDWELIQEKHTDTPRWKKY